MKDFTIRLLSFIAVIAIIIGYNVTLELRAKDEQIAQLTADLEAYKSAGSTAAVGDSSSNVADDTGPYKDGVYTGASDGYGGLITVEVTIEGGNIEDIRIVSAPGEDSAYLSSAESLIPAMISAQTSQVDTVSGATMSSVGIINATSLALNQAL